MIDAADAGAFWRSLTLWQLVELATNRTRRRSSERAQIMTVIWNAHARKRSQAKRVTDFDPIAKAESKAAAARFRREHADQAETLAQFIERNQSTK